VTAHPCGHPGHHALDLFVPQVPGTDVHDVVGVSHGAGIIANMCSGMNTGHVTGVPIAT
jgi:hypothetical protein